MRNYKLIRDKNIIVRKGFPNLSAYLDKSFFLFLLTIWLAGCSISSNRQNAPSPSPPPVSTDQGKDNEIRFKNAKSSFTTLPEKVQLSRQPYIKGKAAFYEQEESSTDRQVNWWLRNDLGTGDSFILIKKAEDLTGLLAQTPSEVQTVILKPLKCEKIRKGSYKIEKTNQTIPGFVERCELIFVDLTIPAVIFRKKLEATPEFSTNKLEMSVRNQGKTDEVFTQLPKYEIYNYLKTLPRK